MRDKEKINHWPLINKAINISVKIQNKGLATVFFDFSGHVNKISFRIYEPVYYDGASYETIECYVGYEDSEKYILNIISRLQSICRKRAIDEVKQKQIAAKLILDTKKAQYERLKKELEETV